ncbi:hypothetical protein LEP1GSC052_0398 [Leptospira kmetyi serovar Malaysia str. Bejo-Iso9]|nr:hypothetical protein LEP1GSC052_0398 [Leptospira kmetyi serovar Malaysia str. Bejo-Iso9]
MLKNPRIQSYPLHRATNRTISISVLESVEFQTSQPENETIRIKIP